MGSDDAGIQANGDLASRIAEVAQFFARRPPLVNVDHRGVPRVCDLAGATGGRYPNAAGESIRRHSNLASKRGSSATCLNPQDQPAIASRLRSRWHKAEDFGSAASSAAIGVIETYLDGWRDGRVRPEQTAAFHMERVSVCKVARSRCSSRCLVIVKSPIVCVISDR